MFTHKYSPKTLKEVHGQDSAINKLKSNINNKIPTLLHGDVGTGKTSSVYALANDLNYEVLEINASDFRNKDKINSIIGGAIQQQSLFKKGKLILIDELDGISGMKDRGGIQALMKLIPQAKHPLILTSNDIWNKKFNTLRKKVDLIEYKELDYLIIYKVLSNIAKKEKIKFKEEDLKYLSRSSKGDLRAALIDLQTSTENNKLDLNLLAEREKTQDIFNALKLIFKTLDPLIALKALDNLKENLDESFLWIEENLPKEYKNEELNNAFNALAKADIFRGRIRRRQYYRFLVYQIALSTAGVALSKQQKNPGFINYTRPSRLLKMFIAKMKNAKKLAISKQIATITHTSTKRVVQDFNIYKNFLKKSDVYNELDLSDDEIKFLKA